MLNKTVACFLVTKLNIRMKLITTKQHNQSQQIRELHYETNAMGNSSILDSSEIRSQEKNNDNL